MVTIFLSGDVVGIDVQCPCVVHTIDHCDEELIEGKKEEVFISILHFKIGTLPYKSTSVLYQAAIPVPTC